MLAGGLPNSLIRRGVTRTPPKEESTAKGLVQKEKKENRNPPAPTQTQDPPATMHTIGIHRRGLQDDASKKEVVSRTPPSSDLAPPDLRFSPGDLSHEAGRAMSSTAALPRKKTTSIDAVTVGTDEVDAGFSSGAKPSANHPGSETKSAPPGRTRPSTHYQTTG